MAGFSIVYGQDTKTPASLPLAASQTIYAGDLLTWNGLAIEAIAGGTTAFCGIAAETPVAGASTILVYSDPAAQFQVACSATPAAINVGKDYAPVTTPGSQVLNLSASGWLRVVQVSGANAVIRIIDHQFSGNEGDAQRVPEPATAGTWLRKVLAGVGSWVAGIPTITGTTGHIPKIKADGTLETAGIAAANLQVLVAPAAAHSVAGLTAGGALEDTGVLTANVMRRPALATAGDVATMTAAKDAEGSGLQLNSVARRASPSVANNLASLDADGDPINSGYAANLLTGAVPVLNAAVTGTYAATIGDCFIEADTSGGDVTITLPIGTSIPDGKIYHCKKITAPNNLIIVPEATEVAGTVRIDGATSQTTAIQWATLSAVRNGGQWRLI